MKRLLIVLAGALLVLAYTVSTLPATRSATRVAVLPASRMHLFQIVSDFDNPSWRPSVRSVRMLREEIGQEAWVEVSDQGHELTFKTTNRIEPEVLEIEFSGTPAIRGHWAGRFTEVSANETRVEFTETVTAESPTAKVLAYLFVDLDSMLDEYIRDLGNKVRSDGHEHSTNQ